MPPETATADPRPPAPDPDEPRRPTEPVGVEESWTAFAAWASDALDLQLVGEGDAFRLEAKGYEPLQDKDSATGGRRSWLGRRRKPKPADDAPAVFTADTRRDVVDELIRRLAELDTPPSARPAEQPEAVHDLTDRLFATYELDDGKAHVAGFHLEDRPFVRLTTVLPGEADKPRLHHAYFDEAGAPVSDSTVSALGLDRVAAGVEPWPRRPAEQLHQSIDAARNAHASGTTTFASIVWAKHASGRLRFEFGEESVDALFDGWARTLEAPPVVCPETGRETRHLTTTYDGRIAAAEAVAECAASGRRNLRSEMATCSVTGELVESSLVTRCAATSQPVLRDRTMPCPRCGLEVSKTALTAAGCVGCADATPIGAADPRLATILDKHPRLAKRRWALAETPEAFVLLGSSWTRRRCVTIEKESLAVRREAEASRFYGVWRPVSPGGNQ